MKTQPLAQRYSLLTALLFICVPLASVLLLSGCGQQAKTPFKQVRSEVGSTDGRDRAQEPQAKAPDGQSPLAKEGPGGAPAAELPRKIIYTAEVHLLVEDLDESEKLLTVLLSDHKGFIAQMEITGTKGSSRTGRWKVRIPVSQFDGFIAAVARLGELQRHSRDSKDVTEEYYDLEARIKNKQIEEERLTEHLKKSTGNLEDILDVERELSRVRGEIEQMQGRLKLLANLTELTTVTVVMHERKGYVPPPEPEFGTAVSRTLDSSVDLLVNFGKGVVLFLVALVPWLPLLALVIVPLWLLARRTLRRLARPSPPAPLTAVPVEQ